jgi:ATP-dependent DNA helicase RecG
MKPEQLLQIVNKGETTEIEFKSWIKARSKKDLMAVITKEAVALANTFGGYILIGVGDDGKITGWTF